MTFRSRATGPRTIALGAAFGLFATAASAVEPPKLDLTLTPHQGQGAVDGIAVTMRLEKPEIAAGKPVVRMPTRITSIPTAAYAASAIHATDDKGALVLRAVDEPPTPTGVYRNYVADRATSGDVRLDYSATPRTVTAQTPNGPLFDLRQQPYGILGAGVYFLALPDSKSPYAVHLRWELSGLPQGSRGVGSFGEGEQTVVVTPENLAFSYYAAGAIHSEPQRPDSTFALYWLSDPPFDTLRLAADTKRLYDYMSRFFQDEGAPYHVFIRANPYPAGGGTAQYKSFMFGYGTGKVESAKDLQILLAHEISHNWPHMDGDDHGATAWYSEGTAEYYSSALSYRSGVIDLARFTEIVNERAEAYYTNPLRNLSNADAGAVFWKDSNAQRVPYGRGFMYLARVDSEVRQKSQGRRSLDDLVLEMRLRQRHGEEMGNTQWRELVTRELGASGGAEYDDMVGGKLVEPAANGFGNCLVPHRTTARPFELGFDPLNGGEVTGLKAGSAAAAAGLQEHDIIVSKTSSDELRDHSDMRMSMTIRRGMQTLRVDYLPRTAPVPSWRWDRVEGIDPASCKL